MTQAYKPPYYLTLGASILLVTEEGKMVEVPLMIEEIGEVGLAEQMRRLEAAFVSRGLRPPTEEEYSKWALGLAAEAQQTRLAAAVCEWTQTRAVDPARMDAIMAAHRGRPGGDA